MSEGVLGVLWIFWTIAFLLLYHKVFTVYYFDLGKGLMKEIIASAFIGGIMALMTLALWYIVAVIIVLFGLIMKKKMESNVPLVLAVIVAIIMCIAGITAKSDGDEQAAMNMNYMYCADDSNYADQEFCVERGTFVGVPSCALRVSLASVV